MANYIIYDSLNPKLTSKPFLAAKTLLEEFYIANQTIKTEKNDISAENFSLNPDAFAKRFAVTLAKAGKDGNSIIALEDNSFASLSYAKNYILNNASFKEKMEQTLNSSELSTDFLANIIHINKLLSNKYTLKTIQDNLKHPLKNFKAAIYIGSDLDFDAQEDKNLNALFDLIELRRIRFDKEFAPSGYGIYNYALETALKMAGEILLDAFDSGIDFLIVNDIRAFYIFDKCREEIEKSVGRTIPLYILTLPQVLLMTIGVTDKKKLGFDAHKIKPTILG